MAPPRGGSARRWSWRRRGARCWPPCGARVPPTCPACCNGCVTANSCILVVHLFTSFLTELRLKQRALFLLLVYLHLSLSSDFDEFVVTNNDVVLKNIAEDLRNHLPIEAMFNSEHLAIQKIHQHPLPMVHVDAFLYDDDIVDTMCEEGRMSRNYCTECGSYKTASLEFISHSFSLMELKFLYQHVLPDLTGKGYLYSSASQLYGVEMNADFCQLQEMTITKYQFTDRIKVVHADICTQASLLQNADVIVMNNVFEYFLDRLEQARAWEFIACNVKKRGSLLVTVPSLKESLSKLQTDIQLSQWVEELQLNYDVYVEKDVDREALEQIHLYRIL
ncbi:uncharacterized protein LOC107315039 isoform X2 [Coturnix japonica]|uniref:uncharacterized protein LOC107315039 isoform X2 n=1 Tax=Coturnix japonica TaxID=93934 RepID=UPI0007774C04|nr:uncharacterized protein LOC107315039 isoform X2 [Coturnix japonica]